MCVVIPKRAALNPFLAITVNGSETTAPLGSSLGAAIHLGRLPPNLKVYKLYAGEPVPVEFDRSGTEILGLVLNGGEKISWK